MYRRLQLKNNNIEDAIPFVTRFFYGTDDVFLHCFCFRNIT